MKTNLLAGITTALIIGSVPVAAYAQKIDCYKQGDIIQCPGYGNFNYRNSGNSGNLGNYGNYGNTPNQNRIESSIREMYLQVLGRDVDASGLSAYTDAVRNRRLSLLQVRRELVNSPEADRAIRKAYQQANGRNPSPNQFQNARLFIANGASLDQLRQELVGSNGNLNNNNYGDRRAAITEIYQQVLGRDPDNSGLGSYSDALQNGRISLVQVRRELAVSPESDRNINKIYQQILGRNVDSNGLRDSRRILESNGGSLDQVQSQLANTNEARGRNGDRTFSLLDLLGIFR
jgi:Domain of unknown function (DUF4214)